MLSGAEASSPERTRLIELYEQRFSNFKSKALSLDMTRGKPSTEQLNLSNALDTVLGQNFNALDGTDTRNYGGLDGIPEAKALFAPLLGVTPAEVLVAGNSSLTLMYQYLDFALRFGVNGKGSAWSLEAGPVSFLCPVPGYDRHFSICEFLGIQMIPVPMDEEGPIMSVVEELIQTDASIRGIWCVPKYSNPSGIVYSDRVVGELAAVANKAHSTFRIMWDNAYAVHDLGQFRNLANIFEHAKATGSEDRIVTFGSTSKITFAGAGVACLGASKQNIAAFRDYLSFQSIGPDKVNQLRHVRFFQDYDGVLSHMEKHASSLRPKFETVQRILARDLGPLGIASWTKAEGGYFFSVDVKDGLAKEVVRMAEELGVKLTPAGSTYPYKKDPRDSNIRIAPSVPRLEEVETAMEVFTTCVVLATLKRELN